MLNLNKAEAIGNRWTKGSMDRIYINFTTLDNLADKHEIRNLITSKSRTFGKVWIDVTTGEIQMKGISNDYAERNIVEILMAELND